MGSDKDTSQIKATLARVTVDDWLALKRRRRRRGGIGLDNGPQKTGKDGPNWILFD